jgi:hypothetical protein
MVAELFIAIIVNCWFSAYWRGEAAEGGIVAFYFIGHAVGAGGHFVVSGYLRIEMAAVMHS